MLEKGEVNSLRRRSRPLILDLRPLPDFEPVSVVHSININLPTLLMRRYRKGGAVSSFALESFITIPSDKDLYHLIQDEWRQDRDGQGNETAVHDVIVLDQEMRAGQEEYGRSASPAWTLVSVLERGGGNIGGSGPIQLWFLEGGFEAFQAWDASEKHIRRPESECGSKDHQEDAEMAHAELESGDLLPLSMPLSLSRSTTSSTMTDAKTAQAIDHAVSLTNASLGGAPRQRGPPARRESLFSLNTKSLQRPAGLSRSQTVGVSALNIKPLSIPTANNPSLHPLQEGPSMGPGPQLPPLRNKGSWLTVPTGGAPSLSPSLSLNIHHANNSNTSGHPLDMTHSNSTDPALTWSANSGASTAGGGGLGGDSQHPLALSMGSKRSFSSTTTTLASLYPSGGAHGKGIQEEEEEQEGADGLPRRTLRDDMPPPTPSGFGPTPSFFDFNVNPAKSGGPLDHPETRMFSEGIESFTNNPSYRSPFQYQQQQFQYGYDDDSMEEGGDDGEQEISCILPEFLYLGPEIVTAEQVQELERLGVKRVLNMARECEDLLVLNHPTIEYHKVGVLDNIEADVSAGLLEAVDIIASSAESPIYVHCKAGKSRSVTATIAYLITHLQWSLNKAYNHVLTQRPCMCPNIGFVTELMRMEERILGNDRAGGLVRAGSLNSILSLSTAGSATGHNHHHYQHHSLQHHHSLSMGGSPKVLSTKTSVNSFAMMSPLQHGGL
ncbi:hypothetical protein BGX29_006752 [Mortierella sp. GBA35]|nr:hypothetical protein BGX29_006752 [Mortierella sp. GBA35]